MKVVDLVRYPKANNCYLYREGGNHSIFLNAINKKISSVPRHRDVKNNLVRKIVKI